MPAQQQFLDAVDFERCGLRLQFDWRHDRFEHRVLAVDHDQLATLLHSIEGTPDEEWPPSAPLQQLTLEKKDDDRSVALLVGMAGSTHWSLGVEAFPDQRELLFDVACRIKRPPERLGSSYRSTHPPSIGGSAQFAAMADVCRLSIELIEAQPAAQLRLVNGSLAVCLSSLQLTSETTVRWRYRISRL